MREYELSAFEATDFQDNYGNHWCNAVFVGVGEPVKVVTPDPSKWVVGDKYFGEIETKTSKAGKQYLKFKKGKKEDAPHDKKSDQYLKDLSDYPIRVFNGALNYAAQAGLNLLDKKDLGTYMTFVQSATEDLLRFSENIRKSDEKPADKHDFGVAEYIDPNEVNGVFNDI